MDNHFGAKLEKKQLAIARLADFEWKIVEADPISDRAQGAGVPDREVTIEIGP